MLTCPNCKALHVVKYGKTRSGTQNYKCRECGRRFVEHPTKKYLSQETWAQIDKLLKEKLPLSGIARVTGISGTWLQRYVNRLYEKQGLEPQPVKKREVVFRMLRQRVSRLVRKTFSKKLENHIGAIIYFINHYNKSLLL
ncbi:MAG: hypothetical protein RIS84_467 [Pseudomonadota bacterium]